jgi:hypothetical protein
MITNEKIPDRSKSIFLVLVLALASFVCLVTAVRIEYLNHLSGDSIQRKAEQEPNSKWRGGQGFFQASEKIEAELRKEKGLSSEIELSEHDYKEITIRMKTTSWTPSPSDQLGKLLGTWGLIQYPLAITLLITSLAASANNSMTRFMPKWVFYMQAFIGIFALALALYRGYFSSLGW